MSERSRKVFSDKGKPAARQGCNAGGPSSFKDGYLAIYSGKGFYFFAYFEKPFCEAVSGQFAA